MIFQLIMVDEKTEKILGQFPYDREVYANAIDKMKMYQPKAIIIKYFIDLPKSEKGDKKFSESINGVKTFLQASINNEPNPNELSEKFLYKNIHGDAELIHGNRGWIPLKIFSDNAYDIGFVNIRPKNAEYVPLVVEYKGKIYKSLWLSIMGIFIC